MSIFVGLLGVTVVAVVVAASAARVLLLLFLIDVTHNGHRHRGALGQRAAESPIHRVDELGYLHVLAEYGLAELAQLVVVRLDNDKHVLQIGKEKEKENNNMYVMCTFVFAHLLTRMFVAYVFAHE